MGEGGGEDVLHGKLAPREREEAETIGGSAGKIVKVDHRGTRLYDPEDEPIERSTIRRVPDERDGSVSIDVRWIAT